MLTHVFMNTFICCFFSSRDQKFIESQNLKAGNASVFVKSEYLILYKRKPKTDFLVSTMELRKCFPVSSATDSSIPYSKPASITSNAPFWVLPHANVELQTGPPKIQLIPWHGLYFYSVILNTCPF